MTAPQSARPTGAFWPFHPPARPSAAQMSAFSGNRCGPRRAGAVLGARRSDRGSGDNGCMDLARVSWLTTVLACLLTAVILLAQGYFGYAGVAFAVAVSAAINLT
jgi:hypothetical protein